MQKNLHLPDAWQPWIDKVARDLGMTQSRALVHLIKIGINPPEPPKPPEVGMDWPTEVAIAPVACDDCKDGRHCGGDGLVLRDVTTKASEQIAILWMCGCKECKS